MSEENTNNAMESERELNLKTARELLDTNPSFALLVWSEEGTHYVFSAHEGEHAMALRKAMLKVVFVTGGD